MKTNNHPHPHPPNFMICNFFLFFFVVKIIRMSLSPPNFKNDVTCLVYDMYASRYAYINIHHDHWFKSTHNHMLDVSCAQYQNVVSNVCPIMESIIDCLVVFNGRDCRAHH